MTAIGTKYITDLPYKKSKDLAPVKAKAFFTALDLTYTKEARLATVGYLFSIITGTKYDQGMRAFQERVMAAMGDDNVDISVEDQKYIADITDRVAAGQIVTSAKK